MHLGASTHGIFSLCPDPSRRTRKPPFSGCISGRQSKSLIFSSGPSQACTQRALVRAPVLQRLLRAPLGPRLLTGTSQPWPARS
ncbi:MAG: hypothetical protein ACK56F_16135 [bacterium]